MSEDIIKKLDEIESYLGSLFGYYDIPVSDYGEVRNKIDDIKYILEELNK